MGRRASWNMSMPFFTAKAIATRFTIGMTRLRLCVCIERPPKVGRIVLWNVVSTVYPGQQDPIRRVVPWTAGYVPLAKELCPRRERSLIWRRRSSLAPLTACPTSV